MSKNQSIVPLSFDAAVNAGASEQQARDMHRKHANKIYADASLRETELMLEQARDELHNSRAWKNYKKLQSQRKSAQKMAARMDDVYMGAVSTGLAGFMPGSSLTEKLYAIKRETERSLQLTNGGDNE